MFFEISHTPRSSWSQIWHLGPLMVGTDAGWQRKMINNCVFLWKGYTECNNLSQSLWQIYQSHEPNILGNFCIIVWDHQLQMVFIKTDVYRSFPIYIHNKHSVSNLIKKPRVAWCDSLVCIDPDMVVIENQFDVIGDVSDQGRDMDWIHNRLLSRMQGFVDHNPTQNLKIFLSGGVDTLLVYSYLIALGVDFEVIKSLHFDFDGFWIDNHHLIQENWAYHQLHHWVEPTVLASGAPGDEFMMRTPVVGNLYLLNHGTSVLEQINNQPNCMHRDHFLKEKNLKIYEQQNVTLDDWELCNITVNDWQHWHLGNTLTWTPLRDLEIFKAILHFDYETVVGQILDSSLSRELMDRNVHGLSSHLSPQKNSGNVYTNVKPLILGVG